MSVKILLAGTVKDMSSFEPGRFNQVYRNDLADALRLSDQIRHIVAAALEQRQAAA